MVNKMIKVEINNQTSLSDFEEFIKEADSIHNGIWVLCNYVNFCENNKLTYSVKFFDKMLEFIEQIVLKAGFSFTKIRFLKDNIVKVMCFFENGLFDFKLRPLNSFSKRELSKLILEHVYSGDRYSLNTDLKNKVNKKLSQTTKEELMSFAEEVIRFYLK